MLTPLEIHVCAMVAEACGPAEIVRKTGLSLDKVKDLRDWFLAERRLVWLQRVARSEWGRSELLQAGVPPGMLAGLRDPGQFSYLERRKRLTDSELRKIEELARPLT